MNSPSLSRWLLTFACDPNAAAFLIGDLEEEFSGLCRARGMRFARHWYRRQVIASLAPILALRLRGNSLPAKLLTAMLTGTAPLLLLDRLWCAAYSQIPLKDGTGRHPAFFLVNLSVSALCLWLQPPGRTGITTLAIALALCCSAATEPLWYVCAAIAIAPAVLCIQLLRRRFA